MRLCKGEEDLVSEEDDYLHDDSIQYWKSFGSFFFCGDKVSNG